MGLGEQVIEDYATLRLSLKAHPLALLRDWLASEARHHRPRSSGTPTPAAG